MQMTILLGLTVTLVALTGCSEGYPSEYARTAYGVSTTPYRSHDRQTPPPRYHIDPEYDSALNQDGGLMDRPEN